MFDTAICENESIASPGMIQDYGVIAHYEEDARRITHVSENVRLHFNQPADLWLNQSIDKILTPEEITRLEETKFNNTTRNEASRCYNGREYTLTLVRSNSGHILEWEPVTSVSSSDLLSLSKPCEISLQPTQDLAVQKLLQQVKDITKYERALFYHFELDGSGVVLAEINSGPGESYLNLHYPASDIPKVARQLYQKSLIRFINNSFADPVPVKRLNGYPRLDLSECPLRSVSSYHLHYLQNMGVRSSCSFALSSGDLLWGLISLHHSEVRYLDRRQRVQCNELVHVFNEHVTGLRAIQTMSFLSECRSLAKSYLEAVRDLSITTDCIQQVIEIYEAEGCAVVQGDHVETYGTVPQQSYIKNLAQHIVRFGKEQQFQSDSIRRDFPDLDHINGGPAGVSAVWFHIDNQQYLCLWFQPSATQEIVWGNKTSCTETEPFTPVYSFGRWREIREHHSKRWNGQSALFSRALSVAARELSK
jgi:two-component system, chemotaxis family, sensor kinase Cph1